MKAAVRDRYGPPEVVKVEDLELPVAYGDEVLVRVRAASINRADLDGLYPRWQFTRLFLGLRRPRTRRLGLDVAGLVESIGPSVMRFQPGDHVFGDLFAFGQGAFAEYVSVRERALAAMPTGITFEDAATLPHSAVLALQGLRLRDGRTVQPGGRVLVVGASGNVGPFAVQIAKSMGADVTGVCSTEKVEFVRSLGADRVVDYTKIDPTMTGERYDWILDVDAHQSLLSWRHALRPKGVYVALGGSTAWLFQGLVLMAVISATVGNRMGLMLWWQPFKAEDVETLKKLIAAGKVTPIIDRRFTLTQIVEALRYVDEGRPRGKVVVTM
ncbi:MAG TPA: NAD(P)-dependent alcohol dehydrogenase [Candidatus Limnocylindria bacterium]|jgi:NADPH:quinone reductase-like Zn-dependent oxidoreductase|nr:NAD(P)-dependent alcohol dehydrogenase [Candidatus Limnocylindria bacterium]